MAANKKQTIAVDVDDVLAGHYQALADWHNEIYKTNHTIQDYISDHWSLVWGTSHEETEWRAQEFSASGLVAEFAVIPGAIEALRKLKQHYNLVIVTARRKENVEHTHEWLNRHFPKLFQEVRFVPLWEENNTVTKAHICQELKADVLIDDSLRHVSSVAECGLRGILFGNYSWNQVDELPKNVQRAENWDEVVELLL